MLKDIVVNLSIGKSRDFAGEFAISVAGLFEAHLSAAVFAYDPPIPAIGYDGVAPSVIDTWREERNAEAEQTRRAFDNRARLAGITSDSRVLLDSMAGSAAAFSEIARNYDLSVVAQADQDSDVPESLVIEAALFESGRPVVIVPYIQDSGIKLDRVMVCWDNSRNAARAIGDAMPFLARAGRIDVVTIEPKEQRDDLRGAQIAAHLARHKLKVELKSIVAPDSDAANVILSQAADSGTDLIVMGGYGHTRFREFILGGATRGILESMTVPVLMSH
jgi:nucleotide-binding universal stress UspA family protein